jgi:hypothetical protein
MKKIGPLIIGVIVGGIVGIACKSPAAGIIVGILAFAAMGEV